MLFQVAAKNSHTVHFFFHWRAFPPNVFHFAAVANSPPFNCLLRMSLTWIHVQTVAAHPHIKYFPFLCPDFFTDVFLFAADINSFSFNCLFRTSLTKVHAQAVTTMNSHSNKPPIYVSLRAFLPIVYIFTAEVISSPYSCLFIKLQTWIHA